MHFVMHKSCLQLRPITDQQEMTSYQPLLPQLPHDRLEMTKEECEEFVKSLKGLESTMR